MPDPDGIPRKFTSTMSQGANIDIENGEPSQSKTGRLAKQLGDRIAGRRAVLSFSREHLADILRITRAELDGFEQGTIRMTALQVFDMAQALGVPIGFFFAEKAEAPKADTLFRHDPELPELPEIGRPRRGESADLLDTFQRVPDPAVRSCILRFVRSLVPHERVTPVGQDNQPAAEPDRESTFEGLARVAGSAPAVSLDPGHP